MHLRQILVPFITLMLVPHLSSAADPSGDQQWKLETRRRVAVEGTDDVAVVDQSVTWDPKKTAIVIVDMWDDHHCVSAAQRVVEMAPHMNRTIKAARERGVLIVHAPSDCAKYYKDARQRKPIESAPSAKSAIKFQWNYFNPDHEGPLAEHLEKGGCSCDTPQPCSPSAIVWTRQIDTLEMAEGDAVSSDGQEIYNLFAQRGIENVIIMGVHTNRCVLGRPFGIRQMVYLGKNVVLCRDLTDSYHRDPGKHFEGLDLIIGHVEKYWCPTITSASISGAPTFRFKQDARRVGATPLQVVEEERTIVVTQADKVVVTYNKVSPPAPTGILPIYERSGCLHPVGSPQGRIVTAMFPFDHAHQQGIFSAWVNTTYDGRAVDFWNLAGRTGRVLHERVVSTFQTAEVTGFEVDLLHRVETQPPVDVLRERWKVSVYPTDGTYHCFDLDTEQTALTAQPLTINEYHYGGIVLRGPTRWLTAKDSDARKQSDLEIEPSEFLNNLGSDRVKGNHEHANWVALSGNIDGEPVSIAVLSHTQNFRSPQAARLHPSKPYFCFSPCVDGAFTIDRDHSFKGRYRFLIADTKPDPKWIDRQWEIWCNE